MKSVLLQALCSPAFWWCVTFRSILVGRRHKNQTSLYDTVTCSAWQPGTMTGISAKGKPGGPGRAPLLHITIQAGQWSPEGTDPRRCEGNRAEMPTVSAGPFHPAISRLRLEVLYGRGCSHPLGAGRTFLYAGSPIASDLLLSILPFLPPCVLHGHERPAITYIHVLLPVYIQLRIRHILEAYGYYGYHIVRRNEAASPFPPT